MMSTLKLMFVLFVCSFLLYHCIETFPVNRIKNVNHWKSGVRIKRSLELEDENTTVGEAPAVPVAIPDGKEVAKEIIKIILQPENLIPKPTTPKPQPKKQGLRRLFTPWLREQQVADIRDKIRHSVKQGVHAVDLNERDFDKQVEIKSVHVHPHRIDPEPGTSPLFPSPSISAPQPQQPQSEDGNVVVVVEEKTVTKTVKKEFREKERKRRPCWMWWRRMEGEDAQRCASVRANADIFRKFFW